MSGSINKAIIIGNLGSDPEIKAMTNGKLVCNLSVATSESWKDKQTGERKEKSQWHRVVIFSEGLIGIAKQYLKKGSKVYIEGTMQTRSYDKDGQTHYTTEIVLQSFGSSLVMLDAPRSNQQAHPDTVLNPPGTQQIDDMDDEVPF